MYLAGINFEFFRVLPVILYFVTGACILFFWGNIGWVFMMAGLLLNGAIWGFITPLTNKYLPKLSERPSKSQCYFFHQKTLTTASGLPSGHCQAAAFFSAWLLIMAVVYKAPSLWLGITTIISIFFTLGMIWSRVYHYKCHTLLQAVIGTLIGITIAIIFMPIFIKLNRYLVSK